MNDYNNFLDLMRKKEPAAVSEQPKEQQPAKQAPAPTPAPKEQLDKPLHIDNGPRVSAISASPFLERLPDNVTFEELPSETLIRKRASVTKPDAATEKQQEALLVEAITEAQADKEGEPVAEVLTQDDISAVQAMTQALEAPVPEQQDGRQEEVAQTQEQTEDSATPEEMPADEAVNEIVDEILAEVPGMTVPEKETAVAATEAPLTKTVEEKTEEAAEETIEKTAEEGDINIFETTVVIPDTSSRSLFEKTRTLHTLPSLQTDDRAQRTKMLNKNDKIPDSAKTRNIDSQFSPSAGLRKTDGDDISVFFPAADDDKGSLLRALAKSAAIEEEPEVEQLEMAGFEQPEPEITDEEDIENEVRQVREKRMEEFGLHAQQAPPELEDNEAQFKTHTAALPAVIKKISARFAEKKTPFAPIKGEEYKTHDHRRFAFRALVKTRSTTFMRTCILLGIGLVLLLMNIITTASAAANNGFFTVFGANIAAYTTVNLVLLLVAAALLLPDLKNGIISVLQLHPRTEAALLGMYVIVLLQTISQYFTGVQPESSYHLFTGASVLLSAIYMFSKTLWYDSTRHCFRTLSLTGSKHYLREVRSPKALRELLSEHHTEGLRADFSARTAFVCDFFADSADSARSAMPRSFLVPAGWVVCLLCGIITSIVAKSPVVGISAAAAASCFAFPVCSLISCGLMMRKTNKELGDKKAYIISLQDARGFVTVDHFAFDADELFDVSLEKTFSIDSVSEKNAVSAASVLAYHAGGTLANAFCVGEDMKDKKMPVPEELVYEEKLGICAWVDNCRVLLGTAEMLVNHNIEPGTIPEVAPDCKLLHLAVEGKPIAAFALRYSCAADKADGLRAAANAGVNLLIRANDPLVTPEMVQKAVGLPDNSIKIVSKSGAELFDSLHDGVSEKESTGIVTANGFSGLCLCAKQAVLLERDSHLSGVATTVCSLVGAGVALLLSFTGGISRATGWSAVILQILWIVLAIAIPQAAVLFEGKGKKTTQMMKNRKKNSKKTTVPTEEDDVLPLFDTKETTEESADAQQPLADEASEEQADEETEESIIPGEAQAVAEEPAAKSDEHLDFVLQAGFEDIFGINS